MLITAMPEYHLKARSRRVCNLSYVICMHTVMLMKHENRYALGVFAA